MLNSFFNKKSKQKWVINIAHPMDRFLAVFFDFSIFSPIIGFVLLPLLSMVEKVYQSSGSSLETFVYMSILIINIILLTVVFMATSLFLFSATPGKIFLKLRVVNEEGKSLNLHQSFMRSIFWVLEFFFCGIPFLEIFSDSHRRPIHDRVARTMVITLKKTQTKVPNLQEAHLVKQILMLSSLAFASCILILSSSFQNLAEKGEFKKAELAEAGYLCDAVTQNTKKEESRILKATTLFLAEEIPKECLLSEVDFVFWRPLPVERDWAYLARAFISSDNKKIKEEYLNRVCDEDSHGLACQFAQYEANPKTQKLETLVERAENNDEKNLVHLKLAVESYESGNYISAEKSFRQIASASGLEAFALKGVMKTLWALNKKETSLGVYLATFPQLRPEEKIEISAWSCHEQVDLDCSSKLRSSCQDLRDQFSNEKYVSEPQADSYVALAFIRDTECRKNEKQNWKSYQGLFQKRKDVYQFVRAISSDSDANPSEREGILADLAFRSNPVSPQFLRRMAIIELAKRMKSEPLISKVAHFLVERKQQDLTWVKTFQAAGERLARLQQMEQLNRILFLPKEETLSTYFDSNFQIRIAYLAKDFEAMEKLFTSRKFVGAQEVEPRSPASVKNQHLSWEKVSLQDIENEFKQYQLRKNKKPEWNPGPTSEKESLMRESAQEDSMKEGL